MENQQLIKSKIESKINNGYELDFGTVFEKAFENYKKIAVYAGLVLLVFSILVMVITITGMISYIGVENLENFGNSLKQLSTGKVLPYDIALPLNTGLLLFSALSNPFMAGFLKMADSGEKDEEFSVAQMFSYYKSPYFINIFLSVFIIGILSTGLAMVLESAGLSFIGTLITMVISFLTMLTIPFIVFGNLNAFDSIKASTQIVLKQPVTLIGLTIVAAIAAFLGIFGLCIGIFFTLPFMYSMTYIIYKTIIGLEDDKEIDEISGME